MNKYLKIYNTLVDKAKTRDWITTGTRRRMGTNPAPPNTYMEVHHIVPKSVGGSNEKSNLVVFTGKEHFIAHLLLTKIYPDNYKIVAAFILMTGRLEGRKADGYKAYRELLSKAFSEQNKKLFCTPEAREASSKIAKEIWEREGYKEKATKAMNERFTPEYRAKLSAAQKRANEKPGVLEGRMERLRPHMGKSTPESRAKISKANKKRASTPEWKQFLRDSYKTSKFNRSKKVLDLSDGTVYDSGRKAAAAKGIKYGAVKHCLATGNLKYNLVWLDNKEKKDE